MQVTTAKVNRIIVFVIMILLSLTCVCDNASASNVIYVTLSAAKNAIQSIKYAVLDWNNLQYHESDCRRRRLTLPFGFKQLIPCVITQLRDSQGWKHPADLEDLGRALNAQPDCPRTNMGSRSCTKIVISEGTSRASLPYLAAI